MNRHVRGSLLVTAALLSACATSHWVSYRQEVRAVLEKNCLTCHTPPGGEGYLAVGLDMATWESLMRGTDYGPVVHPGDSRRSILNMLIEGRADPSLRMPHEAGEPLSAADVELLRRWVDQGARDN